MGASGAVEDSGETKREGGVDTRTTLSQGHFAEPLTKAPVIEFGIACCVLALVIVMSVAALATIG
jgi:hypothetical protein